MGRVKVRAGRKWTVAVHSGERSSDVEKGKTDFHWGTHGLQRKTSVIYTFEERGAKFNEYLQQVRLKAGNVKYWQAWLWEIGKGIRNPVLAFNDTVPQKAQEATATRRILYPA